MFNSDLSNIIKSKPSFDRIVECCPYDGQKNLSKLLTEEIFFELIYHETDVIRKLYHKISKDLFSGIWNKRLLFLHGFAGIGKSTFLRYFIRKTQHEFFPIILDFQEIVSMLQTDHETDSGPSLNPISHGMKQFLYKKTISSQREYFAFVKNNKPILRVYLNDFYIRHEVLITTKSITNDIDIWHNLLFDSNFNDTLILFFLNILIDFSKNDLSKCLIIFDNLDKINLDYFTEDFRKLFPDILDAIGLLSQNRELFSSDFDFVSQFKFIFCLREANNTQINPNDFDRIWYNIATEKIILDVNTYHGAFTKRLEFLKLIYSEENIKETIGLSIDDIISIINTYFKNDIFSTIFLPLFNYDFRKLSISIFSVIVNMRGQAKQLISTNGLKIYGANSTMFCGLISILATGNYIEVFYKQSVNWENPDGFCHPARMLLTFLINHSNQKVNFPEKLTVIKEDMSLFDLFSYFNKIYHPDDIIEVLTSLFKYHSDGWIHPITIKNKLVKNKQSFKKELRLLQRYSELNHIDISGQKLKDDQMIEFIEIRTKLENIKIRHNPASFALLRYILPSYNYYLVINGNQESIFNFRGRSLLEKNSELETILNRVYVSVVNHVTAMRKFLDNKFYRTLGYDVEAFKFSNYCWKYKGDTGLPDDKGFLHETRVITTHIAHLNIFRGTSNNLSYCTNI